MPITPLQPFRIEIPEAALENLAVRLARTRWPSELPDFGWERGVPLACLKDLAEYWVNDFDWRKQEAALNQLPQFVTEIDGQPIHFVHARSPEPDALPLLAAFYAETQGSIRHVLAALELATAAALDSDGNRLDISHVRLGIEDWRAR